MGVPHKVKDRRQDWRTLYGRGIEDRGWAPWRRLRRSSRVRPGGLVRDRRSREALRGDERDGLPAHGAGSKIIVSSVYEACWFAEQTEVGVDETVHFSSGPLFEVTKGARPSDRVIGEPPSGYASGKRGTR